MQTPEDRAHPDVSPVATNRRARLLTAAGVVVAVAVAGGIAYVVISTKPEVKVAERALDPQIVRGHSKMQAHGPNWSQHRPIQIDPYVRAAA
jgi:hypothetical protein